MPHNPAKVRMLDRKMIEKSNLRRILANLLGMVPGLPDMPEDQMKDIQFAAGLMAGLCVSVDSEYFPEQLTKQNFTVPMINLIDLILKLHGEKMGVISVIMPDNENKPH